MTEKMMCPYNPAHSVEPRRYRQHLDKCRKTALNADAFGICKYDWNHHVRKAEIRAHEATCPSRVKFEKEIFTFSENPALSHVPKPTVEVAADAALSTENWDEDTSQMTFNHEERIKSAPFMVLPNGLTPSERKAYYREHQLRLSQMSSATPPETTSQFSNPAPVTNRSTHTAPVGISQPPSRPPLGRGRGVLGASSGGVNPGGVRAPAGPAGRGWSSNFTASNNMAFNDNDYPPLS